MKRAPRRTFILLLLLLLHTPGHAQQQADTPLIDTARINAMRDTIQWRLNQLLDINMLTACLQVRKIENVHGLSLLGPNEPLRDSIVAFENGYETSILVHSFISSNQFWPKALFNPNRLANDMVDPRLKPAVGFDVSFTPQGDSSQRRFAVNILNLSTPELLTQAQGEQLLNVTKQGLASPFAKVKPAATDSVNAALFRGIAQLRTFWEEAQAICNIKRVTFSPADNPRFGFSPLPHELLKAHYGSITVRGRAYSMPWQSLAAGTTEPVKFRVELLTGDTATHPVQLRSSSGAAITPVKNGDGSYTITLTAGSEDHEETIEAFYTDTLPGNKTKDMVVGALRTITYAPVQRTVIPIILNGAKLSVNPTTLTETLNGIYRQAAVTWSVKSAIEITVQQHDWDVEDDGDGKLLIATSMFNRYSSEMQAIIDAIKKKVAPDPEACYLIITDIPNTMGYEGYMPLKSEFAFIFTQSQSSAYRIMAHELGHGAFYLKHPQDEYRIQEATDNLMDKYDQGLSLWKPQWDWIGNPSFRLYMFQQEEDGARYFEDTDDVWSRNINTIACAKSRNETHVLLDGIVGGLKVPSFKFKDITGIQVEIPNVINVSKNDKIKLQTLKVEEKSSYTEISYEFADKIDRIFFRVPKDKANIVLSVIKQPTSDYFSELTNSIPAEESQEAYKKLIQLPVCSYKNITVKNRIKYLGWLASETWTNTDQEEIILSLLQDVSNRWELYDELRKNPKLVISLYNSCEGDNRQNFVDEIAKLCYLNWTDAQLQKIKYDEYFIWNDPKILIKGRFEDDRVKLWSHLGLTELNNISIHPFAPVGVGYPCSDCSDDNLTYLPAIYLLKLSDDKEREATWKAVNFLLNFAGTVSSAKLILTGSTRIARLVGVIDLANITADALINSSLLRPMLLKSDEGRLFLNSWAVVNVAANIGTVGADILTNFVKSGRKVEGIIKILPDKDAQKVLSKIDEAEAELAKLAKTGDEILTEFKSVTGINIQRATDDVLLSKVRSWQGKGDYLGIDNWEVFEIPSGTKLYGGLPGQSEFYSTLENLENVGYDKVKFWESLQVKANKNSGPRPKVGEYVVKKNIKVAISKATANTDYGQGGGWQIFVDDFKNDVELIKEIPLK